MDDQIQQPSTPPSSGTTTPAEQLASGYGKRNWKKWIMIYVVIGALLYAGIYYLILSKQGLNPYSASYQAPKATPQPTRVQDETVNTEASRSANWKTYANQYYTFKYPSDWDVQTVDAHKDNAVVIPTMSFHYHYKSDPSKGKYNYYFGDDIELSVMKVDTNISLDQEIENDFKKSGGTDMSSIKKVVIGGYDGRRFNGGKVYDYDTVLVRNNNKYEVEIDHNEVVDKANVNSINKNIFEQILSTFKFDSLTTSKFTDQEQTRIISLSKTSPDESYTVTEELLGDQNIITIKNSAGKIITKDLVAVNEKEIGYNVKFQCMCSTSFKGWISNASFAIKIVNGGGEEYEYLVDASTGKVDESTFRRIK